MSLRLNTAFLIFIFLMGSCSDKRTNTPQVAQITSSTTETSTKPMSSSTKRKKILFFGDSLTAGYGLEEDEAFPSLIQDRIDSLKLPYEVINAGLSGETSSGGKNRIDWVLREPVDVFVLELGANDMLRGLALDETEKNLRAILDVVKEKSPAASIVVAGMEAPPNMGQDYTRSFRNVFTKIAQEYGASRIPFLLEGVAGDESLNLADGKHPNAVGQHIVKENVWRVIADLLTS